MSSFHSYNISSTIGQFRKYPVLIHLLIGIVAGYFLLHPVTMVMYWFEFNTEPIVLKNLINVFIERYTHAFHAHMLPMSVAFVVLSGLTGLGYGYHIRKVRSQQLKIQSLYEQIDDNIRSFIQQGENKHVGFLSSFRYDYKRGHPDKKLEQETMKHIAGFMNASGGILIIGIDNNAEVKGLANDLFSLRIKTMHGFEKRMMQVIASTLGTDLCPLVQIAFHELAGKEICSLKIDRSAKPVYVPEGDKTVFYLRAGNTTKALNTRETVEYLNTREVVPNQSNYGKLLSDSNISV